MLKLQSLGLNPNTAKVLETLEVSAKKTAKVLETLAVSVKNRLPTMQSLGLNPNTSKV